MAFTVASTPCLFRLKSTRRIFCLCPPPMPRAVMRPYTLRPPVRLRISTKRFSGLVFVMSLKSAYAIYRVDGVNGLNVCTGINQQRFPSQLLGERSHYSCPQSGGQLSVPQVMLSVPTRANGARNIAKPI